MATAFATTARPRRFLRRVWRPSTRALRRGGGKIGERGAGGEDTLGMGWGCADDGRGGGDGRAIDGKPRTKEAIASKATSSQSPHTAPPHRKRQRWSREGQVWGGLGGTDVGRGDRIHSHKVLYGKFLLDVGELRASVYPVGTWFLSASRSLQPLEVLKNWREGPRGCRRECGGCRVRSVSRVPHSELVPWGPSMRRVSHVLHGPEVA